MDPSRLNNLSNNSPITVSGPLASGGSLSGKITTSPLRKAVWFALAYFLCAVASNYLSPRNIPFRIFWLPAGLYAAVLLLNETRAWGWLILAAFCANVAFDRLQGTPLALIFSFFAATTVQAVTGAWLMRRFVTERPNLSTEKEFFGIAIFLAIGSPMLGAVIGATTLVAAGLSHSFGQSWLIWWLLNMSAIAVVTPTILAWCSPPDAYHQRFFNQQKKVLEAALLVVVSLAVCAYFLLYSNGIMSPNKSPVLIVVMWAGLRFGTRGATAIGLLVALIFLFFTTQYFTGLHPDQISSGSYILPLQVAWVMAPLVGLFPAMVLRQRDDKMEELRVSEERFRTLTRAAFEGICISENGRILDVNDQFLKMFGCEREEMIGMTIMECVAPECREMVAERIRTGQETIYGHRLLHKDGSSFFAEAQAKTIHGGGRTLRMTALRDITKRKEAEALLRRSEEKYRKIFENVQDVFYQVDNDGTIIEISPSIERYTGLSREVHLGKPVAEFYYDPKDRDSFLKHLREKGEVVDYELRLKTKTGRLVYASANAHVLVDAEGRPTGIEGSLRDTTEHRQAEQALRESEARLRAMFEASRDAIGVAKKGIHLYANPAYLKLFGFDHNEEIVGTSILDSIAPDRRHEVNQMVQRRAVGEPVPTFYEQRAIKKDGTEFDAEFNVSTYTLNGEIYSLAVIRDITERKRAEAELRRHQNHLEELVKERTDELQQAHADTEAAYRKLLELEKLRDDLVHMVVHDMRSPLTGLSMFFDLLSPEVVNAPDFQEYLVMMRETSRALSGMVTSLLDVSRMEAGQMPLLCEVSDLGQLTNAAIKQLSGLIRGRQISVCGSDASVSAYCDPAITQRIFENLLGNALKFTPEEGSVRIELVVEGPMARFSITDTGPGIPAEYHQKVFEKFGQAEIRKERRAPSSGLGLAFCKLAVEAQGGSIQLESKPCQGSTFHVRLPRSARESGSANAA
jgi:PAS domain S-box-containing protein